MFERVVILTASLQNSAHLDEVAAGMNSKTEKAKAE